MSEFKSNLTYENKEGRLSIVYYTDPLCCWSWGFEPQWHRLLYEFRGLINVRYRMGGLIPDWKSFSDPMNSIHRPAQMGPLWMETKYISGMPIDDTIWIGDAPISSYPACIAIKAAEIQSLECGVILLRALREAVMMNKQNISRQDIILAIADKLSEQSPDLLNFEEFRSDFFGEEARHRFNEDLQNVRIHKIGRFPTLTISERNKGIMMTGYRPYEILLQAIKNISPDLLSLRNSINQEEYVKHWKYQLTERELAEVSDTVLS